ncbi:hypothetical protein [Cyanothece sp. BG0011]|uniref:hypothetical protein n=1 Tax=Cyanothece sp. BG0011 TaxID=2082950 RepID=UPI000D1DFE86|nr:hypothetical protein [Cyanothece sp. BG0011]
MSDLISPQEKAYLTNVISEIFLEYDAQVDKKEVEVFCTNFVEQRDKIQELSIVIDEVNLGLNTIDSLENYHRDLTNAQKKGKSKVNWLKANLKAITNIKDIRKIGEIVQSIQAELINSNNQHLSSLLDENVELFPEISPGEITRIDEETEAVQGLLGNVQNNSLLTTLSCVQQIESVVEHLDTNNQNVSQVAKDCFEGELGNDSELVAKKLVTCGVIVADNEVPMEALEGMDAPQIAIVVDMGITIAKVAYKLAQGKMQVNKAMDYIYDHFVAAIGTVTQAVVQLQTQLMGTQIGAILGSIFGPVGTLLGGIAGGVLGRLAGNPIAQSIKKGVVKIGQFAKESVIKVVDTMKQVGQEIGKKVIEGAKKVKKFLTNLF